MYRLIFFLILISATISYVDFNLHKNVNIGEEIEAFVVMRKVPNISPYGKLISYAKDSAQVYFYKNKKLIHSSYYFDSFGVENKLVLTEKRDYYLLIPNNSEFGFVYDKSRKLYGTKVSVDSTLKSEWVVQIPDVWSTIFKTNNMKLIDSFHVSQKGELHERYTMRSNVDSSLNGSLIIIYSTALHNRKFSFSTHMDSLKQRGIKKMIITTNERYAKKWDIKIDKMTQEFELEELRNIDRELLRKYFMENKPEE